MSLLLSPVRESGMRREAQDLGRVRVRVRVRVFMCGNSPLIKIYSWEAEKTRGILEKIHVKWSIQFSSS